MRSWQAKVSPTLGELEDTQNNAWGTIDYASKELPTVFMGLYSLNDFFTLWKHNGRKAILWCGSDIQRLLNGYWLDEEGKITLRPHDLANWIATYCESYVENEVEQKALASVGISSKVVPSYLGDTHLEVSFQLGNKVYTSVSGDDFKLYGWDKLDKLAFDNPDIEFHLYGNSKPMNTIWKNVVDHGRVPKEQMNEEIKSMQGALRLTEFDGFSEILAKSILMGQWPVSLIEYPHMLKLSELSLITKKFMPNFDGRDYYKERLNKFPWSK